MNGQGEVNHSASISIAAKILIATMCALFGTAAQAQIACTEDNTVTANVVAMDQPILFNRLGASNINGMIYALARDVVDILTEAPVDPNNLTVQLAHIRSAAAELPLQIDDVAFFPDLGEVFEHFVMANMVPAPSIVGSDMPNDIWRPQCLEGFDVAVGDGLPRLSSQQGVDDRLIVPNTPGVEVAG